MSPQERDWDKELAAIDKVIARNPAAPAPVPVAAAGSTPARLAPRSRKAAFATWLQVLLGGVLAIGMTQWPYAHGCGIKLFLYLGAAAVVVLAGIWGAFSSWNRRMGWAHTLALLVTVSGVVLLAREVLPRVGYARHALEWTCP